MSTNKTTNYLLHSWVEEDAFLRSEINENFTALDSALAAGLAALGSAKAEQSALSALQSTVTGHTGSAAVHVSAAERTAWNGKIEMVFGGYTGNGSSSGQTISLGFTPRAVILANDSGYFYSSDGIKGGMAVGPAVRGSYVTSGIAYVVENGFMVKNNSNTSSAKYWYVAIR